MLQRIPARILGALILGAGVGAYFLVKAIIGLF